jgi:uncharacterized protein (TIGR02145 family)
MAYSEQMIVTTLANTPPIVATLSVRGVGKCTGDITSNGGLTITDKGFCYSTYPNPTILENYVSVGGGNGQFTTMLPNMVDGTTYFVRAYATNMLGTSYGQQVSFTYLRCDNSFTMTDGDNNVYHVLLLGGQCWMKENLRTTHYADGTSISSAPANDIFWTSSTVAYYYNPGSPNVNGYLYNWKAVMGSASSSANNPSGVQGICPNGWHVPSDAEWTELESYVSSQSQYQCSNNTVNIAKALASTTGWTSNSTSCAVGNNQSGNNATGFGALPVGYVNDHGWDHFNSNTAYFWSATGGADGYAWIRRLIGTSARVYRGSDNVISGYSVRCLRD